MKLRHVLTMGAIAGIAGVAAADVIDFDDLVGQALVPPNYGGIADWGTMSYYDWSQPPYNPSSPPVRVYDQPGGAGNINFGTDMTVQGAYFSGYGTPNGFLPIYMELYNDNALVHTTPSIDLDGSGTPTWLDTQYAGQVDRIRLVGSLGYFVMDDLTVGEGGPSLTLAGNCPGTITGRVSGATPGGTVAYIYAFGTGNVIIPSGPCTGTQLGLNGTATLAGTATADGSGNASFSGNVPASACGAVFVQGLDVSTCATTNVEAL